MIATFASRRRSAPVPVAVLRVVVATLAAGACVPSGHAAGELLEQPLAPISGPPGATMFTPLAPSQTGVVTDNPYADPAMWGEHYQEYSVGAIGTGVAIGDCDNDGRPDLFVVSKTGPCRLFRNLGGWRFEDITESAGLAFNAGGWKRWVGLGEDPDPVEHWKQGAAFADINNDGWLDLYVCRFGAPNWLFVNRGQAGGAWAGFREEAAARGLALVDGSCMGAFCDYDRDGWLDVYVQTNLLDFSTQPHGRRDYLLHNNGDGTFQDVTERAGIGGDTQGHSATWWDFNNDGWPDLYAANDFAAPDLLYRNNRDGTFTNVAGRVLPYTPYSSMGADLGDVNNDGRIDFLVADMAATTHEKDQRGMADSRGRSKDPPDNTRDPPQQLRNTLFLNLGVEVCAEAAFLAGVARSDWTWSVRWEDLDNDGRLDLHITNGMTREFHNADFLRRVMMTESLAERMRIPRESPELREANLAFRNLGDLHFEPVGAAWGLDQVGVSFGAAFGDLDGDGDLDLVFANHEAGVTLLRNDCPSGHRVTVALRGTHSNRFGVGAIVRLETAAGEQVRQLVLARGYLSTSEPILHFGLGTEDRIARLEVTWPSGHRQVFSDLAADRHYTLTEPDSPPGADQAATSQPDGRDPPGDGGASFTDVTAAMNLAFRAREEPPREDTRQPLLPLRFNRRGPAIAVGDLDGDGRDDLVVGGTSREPAQVRRRGRGARFADGEPLAPPPGAPLDDGPLLVFDADGDGDGDLLRTRASAVLSSGAAEYRPQLYLNDGDGRLMSAPADALPAEPISAGAVAAADFNRDGRLDVFLGARVLPGRYPLPPPSMLWRNDGGGRFSDVTDELAPGLRTAGLVTAAVWSDADNDGWIDLLLAREWGTVQYWRNNHGRGFEDRSAPAGFAAGGTGWWTALAAADFNHDGRPDYVAGNVGLNTSYTATPEEPAVVLWAGFGNGGRPLLVEGHYENGRLLPRRTRKDLGAEIPAILRRFARNDDYARATLEEILGAERVAQAQRFAATEFRSGVFLSQPDGRWTFRPWPRRAQIAPCQGVVAADCDGDGRADIYVVQNLYDPIPYVGRFGGGVSQLLRGDGRGGFEAVPPDASGLVVPGDAKALVVLDFNADGWPDFLVSRNNDTALAWQNRGVPGRRSLAVRLQGRPGNPAAVGAQIALHSSHGPVQTAEIYAGSGYYSQSASLCFLGWAEEDPPQEIHVRWPEGTTSVHPVPPDAGTLLLAHPDS